MNPFNKIKSACRAPQLTRLWIVFALILLLSSPGCDRSGGTVRHGNLSYDATEVFGVGTPALALAKAVGRGDVKEIKRLVADGTDVNTVGKYEITPLWWAAWTENYDGFVALLEAGANPNAQRKQRYPVMILVADMNNPQLLEAALKHGGDPNLRDGETGETPLFPAVLHGRKSQIELLLAAKADANAQMPIGHETLPMVALGAAADYQLAYQLLQAGADPTVKMDDGRNLTDTIEFVSRTATNNDDPWRAKVIEFMKAKGMVVKEPLNK